MSRLLRRLAYVLLAGLSVPPAAARAAKPPPLEPGLVATYSAGDRGVTRVAAMPNFTLKAEETIHPQVPGDFSLTYNGVIRILQEGDYTFGAEGGGTIAVDGKVAGTVHLTAGDHAMHVEYTRKAGPARLQLVWSSTLFPPEPIPAGVMGHAGVPAEVARATEVERGRVLVQELNCVACHKGAGSLVGRPAPDLSAVGSRASARWMYKWLEDPRHFRRQAVMPVVLKNDQDRRDVVAYLATLKDAKPDERVVMPSAELARVGQEVFGSVGCANCHDAAGPSLEGQASKWVSAGALAKYLVNPVAVDASGRMPDMMLDQGQADALAAYLFTAAPRPKIEKFEAAVAPGDAERGRLLFGSTGCASCHTLPSEKSTLSAPDLVKLKPHAGCLASAPPTGSPIYGLVDSDREAIGDYLRSIAKQPEVAAAAPTYAYEEHVRQLNCAACHSGGEAGGRVKAEGVPPLSIVGQKLRPEWIKGVLEEKRRVRPWVKARMPHFGAAVRPLVGELVATSGAGEVDSVAAPSPQVVAEGRRLVGAGQGGLSCITCHSVNDGPVAAPEQSRGPELTLMTQRLRGDWFGRWVREPGRVIPNTVMPSFFAGKPIKESGHKIETIWAYLSLGSGIPTPSGANQADKTKFVLVPTDRPIVQRCYLDGGGVEGKYSPIPRAVAVGLPGGLSYAFDPEAVQLRYAWTGEFLDMTGGWNGRGDTHGRRLGTPVYNAPAGPQVYVDSVSTKPVLAYRGYAVTKDAVELLYSVNHVEVRERVSGAGASLTRSFTFGSSDKPIYLVFPAEPGVTLKPSAGAFEAVPTPTGWEANAKAVALKIATPTTVSVTIAREAK